MPCLLVTGSSRGLGRAFALDHAEAGWDVIATCRDPEAAELGHPRIEKAPLDVRDGESIAALRARLTGRAIDVLLLNAGVTRRNHSINQVDAAPWLDVLATNTVGPLMVAHALIDNVATSARRLIAGVGSRMGSFAAHEPEPPGWSRRGGAYEYRSSKAALAIALRALAFELKSRGIIVFTLDPGWVRTDMGGDDAPRDAATVARAFRDFFDQVGPQHAGGFWDQQGRAVAT